MTHSTIEKIIGMCFLDCHVGFYEAYSQRQILKKCRSPVAVRQSRPGDNTHSNPCVSFYQNKKHCHAGGFAAMHDLRE